MKQTGFSLVELLVAMTIFSTISLISFQSFSFFSQRWQGNLGNFDQTILDTRTQLILWETLQQLTAVEVLDRENIPRVFFEGNRNGFVTMSRQSITEPDSQAIVRLSARQGADFAFELIYEEWPLLGENYISITQEVQFSPPVVLHSDLSNVTFEYFGLPDTSGLQDTQQQNVSKQWFSEYDSFITNRYPESVIVSWIDADNLQQQIQLQMNDFVEPIRKLTDNSPFRVKDVEGVM